MSTRVIVQGVGAATRALCLGVLVITGCSSSSRAPTSSDSELAGQYSVTLTRSAAQCSPQALPAPASNDTTYVQLPTVRTSTQLSVQVQLNDSTISLLPESGSVIPLSTVPLAGRFIPPVGFLALSTTQTEGLRAGGHTFSVAAAAADSATFLTLVLSPPGQGVEATVTGHGSGSFTYRDGGPTGKIFTTCTVTDTLSGTKTS